MTFRARRNTYSFFMYTSKVEVDKSRILQLKANQKVYLFATPIKNGDMWQDTNLSLVLSCMIQPQTVCHSSAAAGLHFNIKSTERKAIVK